MSLDPHHLRQHLELAAQAYGSDLPLIVPAASVAPPAQPPATPPQATARTEAIAMPVVPPAPAPAPARPASPVAPAPAPPTAAPAMTTAATAGDRVAQLQALKAEVLPCTRCKLHQGRIQTVFGEGNPHTRVLFVGEAPGAVEDQTGRPFVGPAGQLLDRILAGAMGLDRKDVFIANINKCRPPGNRAPEPDEVAACLPFLLQQVAILQPEVIVCLGRTAAQNLLGTTLSTTALRGRELQFQGIPVVVTWHPSYLLREPAHKRETWDDIKRVNRLLGLPEVPPPKGS